MDLIFRNLCIGGGLWWQIFMALMINIPLVSYGMTMGWLSPNTAALQTDHGLTDDQLGWMASVTFLVALPSVFVYWAIIDCMGRKTAMILTSLPFVICWSLKIYSQRPWALITARAVAGLGSSGCFVVAPIYVKEISQDSIRGALGSIVVLAQNLGYLLVYIMSDMLNFKSVLWICFGLPLVHVAVFLFLPESPIFSISRDKMEEAEKTLAWLRQKKLDDKEISQALETFKQEETSRSSNKWCLLKSLLSDTGRFRRFRLCLAVVLAQELCGLVSLVMFSGKIFQTAGHTHLTPNQQVMILGVVQLAGSILATTVVEKLGRKPLLAASAGVITLCMLLLGVWFLLLDPQHVLASWLPIVCMCAAIFCDSAGLQPVPYIIMAEMFTFELRGTVTTLVMACTDLANFAELEVFHPIINNLGMHTCFFIFATISFVFFVYIVACVPETMGKSVNDIANELDKRNKKNKHNNNVVEITSVNCEGGND